MRKKTDDNYLGRTHKEEYDHGNLNHLGWALFRMVRMPSKTEDTLTMWVLPCRMGNSLPSIDQALLISSLSCSSFSFLKAGGVRYSKMRTFL